jgi:glycosyltransferase involved in cell wall biosynthesis
MKLYVIIVTYNGAPWIRGALDSLRKSEIPTIPVVVDNASTDDSVAIVRREYPEAVLVEQGSNTGFGRGNNVGISLALARGADYIFLLNQDAFITPTALGSLVEFLEQHPEYSVATPLHCSPDLNSLDLRTQRGFLHRYVPEYLSDACLGKAKEFYEIRGINAAAWMVRSAAFMRAGGFDPIFFMYGEDVDLIARFAYLGERFALLPASRIVHLRERCARPRVSLLRQLWNGSELARSVLLCDVKDPRGRLPGKLSRLLSAGIIHPIGSFFADYDWKDLCIHLIASVRVLAESRKILRNSKLCGTKGAHFLDV